MDDDKSALADPHGPTAKLRGHAPPWLAKDRMSARALARRASRVGPLGWLLAASVLLNASGLALSGGAATFVLTAAQSAVLAALFIRALRGRRGWRSAEFVTATAWGLLFTVPCWLYALDPQLLDVGSASDAVLIVNAALYGYWLGLVLRPASGPPVEGTIPVEPPMQPRPRVLLAWWLLGAAALAALLLRHGDPLGYLSQLDRSAALNLGAFYLVALALMMRYAALAWAAARWSRSEPLEPLAVALAVGGTLLISLTGGRLFVAVALVDFLLLYVLLRRSIPLRRVAPYAAAIGILIVFGAGTLKRWQGYNTAHPDAPVSLGQYATERAPSELADAYANNYVDSVRLLALAEQLVPASADWERGRALLEMAVRPLPRAIRPQIERQAVLAEAFNPTEEYAFAMPLVATAYLAGGLGAVLLVSLASGLLVTTLDRRLAENTLSAGGVAVLVVAVVGFPSVVRAGVPDGVVLLLVDVIGMWVVVRTGLRPARPRDSWRPAAA